MDPVLAKSRVAPFYGGKKPPAKALPVIKVPSCQLPGATPAASKGTVLEKSRVASFYGGKKPPARAMPGIKAPSCQPQGDTPAASKDPVLAKSRVASFYGNKKPPARAQPVIKAPSCQPLGSALPQNSAPSKSSLQPVASQQHDKPTKQAAVAAASVLPDSAEATEQFMADFVSHLAGLSPATEDAAVKPHEALAAEPEAKRNAQVSSSGFFHSLLMISCMDGTNNSLCLLFVSTSAASSILLQQVQTGEAASVTCK